MLDSPGLGVGVLLGLGCLLMALGLFAQFQYLMSD